MRLIVMMVVSVACAAGQVAETLKFDSVTLRPSSAKSDRGFEGGPLSGIPDRYSAGNASLAELLMVAYDFKGRDQIVGPAWFNTAKFDLLVRMPPTTSPERFREMMRNLLTERFKIQSHQGTTGRPIYELHVLEGGSKLGQGVKAELTDIDSEVGQPGSNGFPKLSSKRNGSTMAEYGGRRRLSARQAPASMLPFMLQAEAGRSIVDKTGLTGVFDFTLEFDPRRPGTKPVPNMGPPLAQALEEQLGLRLVAAKIDVDALIVESAQRVPVGN